MANFNNANAVDVLRCAQKDEQFVDLYSTQLSDILRLCGNKYRNNFTKYCNPIAQFLYYGLTSLSKLQTLGEEYTGILRFVKSQKNIPSQSNHLIWLLLFIGGDEVFNKSLTHFENKLKKNYSLTPDAKSTLLKWIEFLKNNKTLLLRINQTLFYMSGKYYHMSNRLTGIQYVFLRSWMGDDSSITALNLLGKVSLLYVVCTILHKIYESIFNQNNKTEQEDYRNNPNTSTEDCFICAESKTNSSALSCGHVFCWNCIFSAMSYSAKCPICRENIQPSRIILLQNY